MQHQTNFLGGLPPTKPVTKWLCIITAVVSLFGAILQRKTGFGTDTLIFSIEQVLSGELWRLVTYAFVERAPFGLILSILMLWIFGRLFEDKWGSRDFIKFMAYSSIGAAILAIPLSFIVDTIMPFKDLGIAEGPSPALDALIVSLAVTAPDSNILFGFVLPMKTRHIVYLILGLQLIVGILSGAATLGVTLGGMTMGYLLTTGNWRPQRVIAHAQLWKYRRRRKGLRVVPRDDGPTLH
jgi:membrane associated rhomboid family serine protease